MRRPFPFETRRRILRDCGDKWWTNLAAELVTGGEGGRVGIGGVERDDGFEEAGVVGMEVGKVEEL